MIRWPLTATLFVLTACATAQRPVPISIDPSGAPQRPIPYPVTPPPSFQDAIREGTRTETGSPGPAYWQNGADYRIRASVLTDEKRLEGSAAIRYHNRSPDTLNVLVLDLTQNFHAPGAVRMEPAEITGGIELGSVQVRGRELGTGIDTGPRYAVDGTKMYVAPHRPVLPGESVDLAIEWAFAVPQAGAGERMGYSGDNLFFFAYWFPRMAVYDDVEGWSTDQFTGTAEFYHDFGNFELEIAAPEGWVVASTGTLTNAEAVLAPSVLERLRVAERSDTVVHVLTPRDFRTATRAGTDGVLRWSFVADSVIDVAFSVTRESIWDAARAPVGDRDGDGRVDHTVVHAFYREPAFRWAEMVRYEQHAIRFLSEYTATPYPWPHMTAVEGAGIMGGGMEYPMMTLIGDYTAAGDEALYNVTVHELAHMWVPMIASVNERRYGWFDEGTTSFNENQARKDMFPGVASDAEDAESYLRVARAGLEGEIMRWSAYHYPGPAYVVASYRKPATVLVALRGLLGEETFNRAYRAFFDRWEWKHPYPWDLWNTFEDVSGQELDWFWRSWYYETWLLDQAVAGVTSGAGGSTITVRDLGDVPMPARLTVTLQSGEVLHREVPVSTWLAGSRTASVTVDAGSPVVRVEIDAEHAFPDANRENNVWTR
jgi:hypothetical protein